MEQELVNRLKVAPKPGWRVQEKEAALPKQVSSSRALLVAVAQHPQVRFGTDAFPMQVLFSGCPELATRARDDGLKTENVTPSKRTSELQVSS